VVEKKYPKSNLRKYIDARDEYQVAGKKRRDTGNLLTGHPCRKYGRLRQRGCLDRAKELELSVLVEIPPS
jgi:hypothetical protein